MTTRRARARRSWRQPRVFHLLKRRLIEGPVLPFESCLDGREAPLELGVRAPQGAFGIDPEMAGEVGDGEQKIPDLVLDPVCDPG